ncbi:dehydratase [Bisgaard Taxon 10/6]|uniref:ApeP family dehydratase n=1 Tax=Exercitatus varius TaxID=67857 RepID=UPI00294AE355|nr:dehydratase [Exercitatus varius]MDG2961321.1 dehydratase [Exercitatus varius]
MAELHCPINEVESLLPHSGRMVLIDRVTGFGEDFLEAEACIHPDHILLQEGKFASFSAIEIMAQGVAAWAGCMARLADEPVRQGYLLGSRKLFIYRPEIAVGCKLKINVKMSLQDATGFGIFDCQLLELPSEQLILQGALNVFSPKDEKIT